MCYPICSDNPQSKFSRYPATTELIKYNCHFTAHKLGILEVLRAVPWPIRTTFSCLLDK